MEINRKELIMKIDELEHNKEAGFYDKELDMFFDDLVDWATFKYGDSKILNKI